MQKLRSIFSILFLFLFLFPQVEKSIHDLKHANDFHCQDKSASHLHEKSHTCSLCDYTFTSSDHKLFSYSASSELVSSEIKFFYSEGVIFSSPRYNLSSRAPPLV